MSPEIPEDDRPLDAPTVTSDGAASNDGAMAEDSTVPANAVATPVAMDASGVDPIDWVTLTGATPTRTESPAWAGDTTQTDATQMDAAPALLAIVPAAPAATIQWTGVTGTMAGRRSIVTDWFAKL